MRYFIINETAGSNKHNAAKKAAALYANETGARLFYTNGKQHATQIAKMAVIEKAEQVIAVGGDGTLSEIAAALAGSDVSLGLIPCGTGNDFASALGIPMDYNEALKLIDQGVCHNIDAAMLNGTPFINAAGIGFDAEVVANVHHFKKKGLTGLMAYGASTIYTIANYKCKKMRIEADGSIMEGKFLLASVANGKTIGGGMKIAPKAELDDGLLDVSIIGEFSAWEVISLLPKFVRGKHINVKGCQYFNARHIKIETEEKMHLQYDGEIILTDKVEIDVMPGALHFAAPQAKSINFNQSQTKVVAI